MYICFHRRKKKVYLSFTWILLTIIPGLRSASQMYPISTYQHSWAEGPFSSYVTPTHQHPGTEECFSFTPKYYSPTSQNWGVPLSWTLILPTNIPQLKGPSHLYLNPTHKHPRTEGCLLAISEYYSPASPYWGDWLSYTYNNPHPWIEEFVSVVNESQLSWA